MPDTLCPRCQLEMEADDEDIGRLVKCPKCRGTFIVRTGDARPFRPASVPLDDLPAGALVRHVAADMRAAGIGIQVLGFLHLASGLIQVVLGVMAFTGPVPAFGRLYLGSGVPTLIVGTVMVIGGRQMRRVKSYKLCVTAACLAISPLTVLFCLGWLAGLVFGVIAAAALMRPHVRRAFLLNDSDADPDAG